MSTIESWTGMQEVAWIPVLQNQINLGSIYKIVPTEGYIAWEYNPLRNYRLSQNMYEKDGKYYTYKEFLEILEADYGSTVYLQVPENLKEFESNLPDHPLNKAIISYNTQIPEAEHLKIFEISDINKAITDTYLRVIYGPELVQKIGLFTLREAGELVDFITDELSFNLQNPVDILPQYSYDGSVNLILNDGLNIPRLINSRFTVTGRNTYKVIDRKGDNDTNIYDQGDQFDVDTSLFKNVNKIPQLEYLGTTSGNMKIGNYHFYFKYSDSDGNESDWVAESGLVSVFMGNTPQSVNTGIRDENSLKSVRFKLSNIDIGYTYVKVYYTRYSADVDSNLVVQAKRIDKNFLVNSSGICNILINGDENETEVTLEEINSSFDVIQNAQTQCSAANRLFMANIHKSKVEYEKLSKLSLCFLPYKYEEDYPLSDSIDENYDIQSRSEGYYSTKYIYDKTSYWPGELYRIGVVYILKDGSLSPVFNIRGATNIPTKDTPIYKIEKDFVDKKPLADILQEIDYSEEDFIIIGGTAENENAKGVIQLSTDSDKVFPTVGINITTNDSVIQELKNYVKGFFFVRQKRMPLTLAQGIVVGLDNESNTPTLPTLHGVIDEIRTDNSFVESQAINDINYVSEGFLSRYYYNHEKLKTEVWKEIGKAIAIVAVLTALVVASIFTCGAAAVATGAAVAASAGALISAGAATAITTTAIVGASVAGVAAVTASIPAMRQTYLQNRNKEEAQQVKGRNEPVPEGYERKEKEDSRQLIETLEDRYIITDPTKNTASAIIVPDYQVNQPYYNQFLTGDIFTVNLSKEQPITNYLTDGYFESKLRHFYTVNYQTQSENKEYQVKLVGVPDGCPVKLIGQSKYKARAGYPEEAFKYEFIGKKYDDYENMKANSDIIRGNFGSYVGMQNYKGHACDQINIMIPGYQENLLFEYVQLRAQDTSSFYAISDRIDINQINKDSILQQEYNPESDYSLICYRGDSYICQFTHRIIRNFNDPSAPYNDDIVDTESWKENYNPENTEEYANINLGDVNAVPLGLWLTFKLRSSYNLNIRTVDKSHVDEYLMCGNYRSFYPNYGQAAVGSQKIPDSDQYNKGFSKSVSERYYFEVPDVPYIKQEFQNRIVFSDIHINDAYKNGFRVLRTMNHKDYPMTYGSITKLVELQNALLVVFEHGVGVITINNSSEHPSQILSDVKMLNDTYGSQWKDSIIKTPSGVYGVDTVAKKIWRVKDGVMELISDLKVQEFLNQNITLSERELTPILGVRNVKTLYNAFKHDVMFTFYDNLHGVHEKAWNLCWNEMLGIFTTFYSWIPSNMENIDNIPFSFDRDTVKAISKLGVSNHDNDYSDGVTLSNNVMEIVELPKKQVGEDYIYQLPTFKVKNKDLHLTYMNKQGEIVEYDFINAEENKSNEVLLLSEVIQDSQFIGFLHLDNRSLPEGKVRYHIDYELLRDDQNNYKMFEIKKVKLAVKTVDEMIKSDVRYVDVCYLALKEGVYTKDLLSDIYYRNKENHSYADIDMNKVGPLPAAYSITNKVIPETRIVNKETLDRLLQLYGPMQAVGNTSENDPETAWHCGYLGEIYSEVENIPELGDFGTSTSSSVKWHGIPLAWHWLLETEHTYEVNTKYPIFKNTAGKRVNLPQEMQINPDKIVRYLNIRAKVMIEAQKSSGEFNPTEAYYNQFATGGDHDVYLINSGYFESTIAITTSFNVQLLTSDFWKHGQAGLFDISDKIYPTYWYGKQHPFEFECVVVDDPSVHKIFTNLQLVANKVKPESFHYEVVGDVYDFAEDKPTMYFRQEALKALYQYNGYDIEYNSNFLDIEPKQHNKSADLPKYYSRWDSTNHIYDSYKRFSAPIGFNYDHLSGAEIVYYPTRNEFRVWNHVQAIDVDSLSQDVATSVIKANCRYLEDKWLVSINPIVVTYKNEMNKSAVRGGDSVFAKDDVGVYKYSTWVNGMKGNKLPPINIQGTKLEEKLEGNIEFPGDGLGKDNALYGLYDLHDWKQGSWKPIDPTVNKDRRETDVRGKFMKVRIRYSGEELAIIDFLNTIYQISYA